MTPWTVACQPSLSVRFCRQEYWSGLPCPPPGNLPNLGIQPTPLLSPSLAGGFLTTSTTLEAPENLTTVYFSSPLSFLNYPDNHAHKVTQLEPDILDCEVSGAWASVTKNKASGGDGIPAELFQILKGDAVKVLHSTCQQIWKTQQWLQDWKRSVFIPVPKKGSDKKMFKNYHTIVLISHADKIMLKILQARLQHWRRQWHPTPVLLPGKSHGWRSLIGCSPWAH